MKTVLALLGLALVNCSVAADETATAERIAALRESFRYTPIAATGEFLVGEGEPAVVLETLTVTQSMSRRALTKQIEDRWARVADEAFAWKKGGLLSSKKFGALQADFGTWVEIGDKNQGANPSREIFVKVELLRIRW